MLKHFNSYHFHIQLDVDPHWVVERNEYILSQFKNKIIVTYELPDSTKVEKPVVFSQNIGEYYLEIQPRYPAYYHHYDIERYVKMDLWDYEKTAPPEVKRIIGEMEVAVMKSIFTLFARVYETLNDYSVEYNAPGNKICVTVQEFQKIIAPARGYNRFDFFIARIFQYILQIFSPEQVQNIRDNANHLGDKSLLNEIERSLSNAKLEIKIS